MGCCVQFGWGGQQDPSGMTFEERLEEGEGGAVFLGGRGRLSHQGDSKAKVLRQEQARLIGIRKDAVAGAK